MPWTLYLSATVVGGLAGLAGGAFHAALDQAALGREAMRGALEGAPFPGWLALMIPGAFLLVTALWIVRRFAPETAGSGVQEVEAILAGERKLRWRRVLPVKFVAGLLSVGSGLVLGREGPTIHMGAALGQMASERMALDSRQHRALIAAGAAAGLAAAFNAPLAAIVFVTEELREHFDFSFAAIQSVILACCTAVVVSGWILGQGPDLPVTDLAMAPIAALPLFLVLGVLIGSLGVLFNGLLLNSVQSFRALSDRQAYLSAAAVGMALGALLWLAPDTVGGGETLVEALPGEHLGVAVLLGLLAVRMLTTVGSYGVGLPGGIFAPMLALGTIAGALFAELVGGLAPSLALEPGVFAVAAMGALFAATVRAPLTGIILVIELTGAQVVALPITLTCLTATFTAEAMGGRPIYSLLLGLGNRPAPRAPARRLLAAGMILAAMVAIDRLHVAQQDQEQWTDSPRTLAESDRSAPQPSLEEQVATTLAASTNTVPGAADGPWSDPTGVDRPPRSGSAESSPIRPEEPPVAQSDAPQVSPSIQPQETARTQSKTEVQDIASTHSGASVDVENPAVPSPMAGRDRYSIQLISFREPSSMAPFAQREGILGQALTTQAGTGRLRWHPVLIGEFASRDNAEGTLERLPDRLRNLKPVIRKFPPDQSLTPLQ